MKTNPSVLCKLLIIIFIALMPFTLTGCQERETYELGFDQGQAMAFRHIIMNYPLDAVTVSHTSESEEYKKGFQDGYNEIKKEYLASIEDIPLSEEAFIEERIAEYSANYENYPDLFNDQINNPEEARDYLVKHNMDVLLQEYYNYRYGLE